MKRISLLFLAFVCSVFLFGQMSGTKSIPGDFTTIAAAVAELNFQGVGSGGITFNVAAGHAESVDAPITVTATGTSSNPIVFTKSGAGSNPLVTRDDAGTLATAVAGGAGDAIIRLEGTDYFTWNQINLAASKQGIEYGFMTHKPDGGNGCRNISILNSVITMTKGTSAYVTGIYISNGPSALNSATGVTVTGAPGMNSHIVISGNTVKNVHTGIHCRGSASQMFPDEEFNVGQYNNGNVIENFGGGSTSLTHGIIISFISNVLVNSNEVDNQSAHAGAYYGIYFNNVKGFVDCSYNTITVNNISTTFSNIYCIYINSSPNSINLESNTFAAYPITSTGNFSYIYCNGSAGYTYISENGNYGGFSKSSGTTYCIYVDGGGSISGEEFISNNQFTSMTLNSGTSEFYGIYTNSFSPLMSAREVSGNLIEGLVNNGTGNTFGIRVESASGEDYISYNTIQDLTAAGDLTGISFSGQSSNVTNNNINDLVTSGDDLIAIKDVGSDFTHISRNRLFNLASTHSSPLVRGINIGGVSTDNYTSHVYNNYISDLRTPNASKSMALAGIYIDNGHYVNVYYNTILLNASSTGSLFGTAGIYATTSVVLDMRNNIIVNISTPNGASGYTAAYRRSSNTNLSSYSILSNCNNLFAGTPGPNRLIFYDNSNAIQTLEAYKIYLSTRDGSSISELPPFVNSVTPPFNLHLQTGIPTQCESGGVPIASPITVGFDFDFNARNSTTPDIGADEFSGVKTDLMAPAIALTPLTNTAGTGNRTLRATIIDASVVPVNGAGLPVLYWRINGGAYTGVQAIPAGANKYDFTFGGGVSINDQVQYFIAAQDLSGTPRIGSYPYGGAGFSANPPACTTPPANPLSYSIKDGISGTVTLPEDYPSLTGSNGLFAAINNKIVTGNITAIVNNDLYEDGSNLLLEWLEDGAGSYTLTIQPGSPENKRIIGNYGNFEGGLILLLGADRVTFDGRFNGAGNYLSFLNTSSTQSTSVFHISSDGFGDGCTDITIRNCNISGGSNILSTAYGIFAGDNILAGSSGPGNHRLWIIDNVITKCFQAIHVIGQLPMGKNEDLIISGNVIGSEIEEHYVSNRGIEVAYAVDPEISNNKIFNLKSLISGNDVVGIKVGSHVANPSITGNIIYGLSTTPSPGYGAHGISMYSINATTNNITIANNLIYDLSTIGNGNSTLDNPIGIWISGGFDYNIYHNTVSLSGSFTDDSEAHLSSALYVTSASGLDIRNNILANSMTGITGTHCTAIRTTSTTTFQNIDHNNYFVSGPNGYLAHNGTLISTLSGWQAFTGKDSSSITADPLFINDSLELSSPWSPAIGAAAPVGITADLQGNARHPVHPSIGAYDYLPAITWLGNTSAWNAGSNWNRNVVPDDSYHVIIPTSPVGGNFPLVPTGVFQCHSLHLESGSSLNIQGQLEVKSAGQ
jgi:hypothetical protein